MAVTTPSILFGKVRHARFLPKRNRFSYGMYYIACPLDRVGDLADGRRFGVERFGLLSFYARDHGARKNHEGATLEDWIRALLAAHEVPQADGQIVLVTMPRVLGYVFNPVSFWLCLDRAGDLRAVLCEVNNTFGESHNYLCVHGDRRPIVTDDWLYGEKFFHVSPFLEREGSYRFRFACRGNDMAFTVNHYDAQGELRLATSLSGHCVPASRKAFRRAFWRYPLVTFRAIMLIHWQAVKLLALGIRYIPKPIQKDTRLTRSDER